MTRLSPQVVVEQRSPNVSDRSTPPSIVVLHSTESANVPGRSDLEGVAGWFANPSAEVSAHVVVDGEGHSARCVSDRLKAWACVSYNSASLNVEQIGFASQEKWPREQLEETARWIAEWSIMHGIPIRRARVAGGLVIRSGVTTHKKLGAAGGGHVDPGPAYPLKAVLRRARRIKKLREAAR